MRVETLNVWSGRVFDPLMEHLEMQREDIDVFCFQEVCDTPTDNVLTRPVESTQQNPYSDEYPARADMFRQLAKILPEFQGIYRPTQEGIDFTGRVDYKLYFGLAMFVRKALTVVEEGETYIYGTYNSQNAEDNATMGRNMQYIRIEHDDSIRTIANLHGLWSPQGKEDTPERLEQSRRLLSFLQPLRSTVVCGDFNVNPMTRSVAMLEEASLHNLVREYNVPTTRTRYYKQPAGFGTYIFTSSDIEVGDCFAHEDEVSDHRALVAIID